MLSKKQITIMCLLVLISQQEYKYNGYVLKKKVGENFNIDTENVFPILRFMVENKWVDVQIKIDTMNRTKKFYALNENGWSQLNEYVNNIKVIQDILVQKGENNEKMN